MRLTKNLTRRLAKELLKNYRKWKEKGYSPNVARILAFADTPWVGSWMKHAGKRWHE